MGVMSALNCIGEDWSGECEALQTGLLRNEWDFHGCVVTDYAAPKYMKSVTGVLAGNNLWLAPMGNAMYEKPLLDAARRWFVSGSAKATSAYCSMLAKYSGCRVVSINYALAPEQVWPSAVNDVVTAYLALRHQFPEAKFCLTGESAGGNLVFQWFFRISTNSSHL